MQVNIDDRFYIRSDDNCFILAETKRAKDEKAKNQIYERIAGYHGTVEGALTQFTRETLRGSNVETVDALMAEIKKLQQCVEAAAKVFASSGLKKESSNA